MVRRALDSAAGADVSAARGRALDDERLLELRDEVAVAKPEDLPALFEQMHHLGALRAQRGRSLAARSTAASPYFAHMRLEEPTPSAAGRGQGQGRRGGATCSSARARTSTRRAGIRIVDWRHAPVSRIYYRYGEGDDYEEELGDRMVEGVVAARRRVEHRRGELVRVVGSAGHVRARQGRPMAPRRASHRARLETENEWPARHGVTATSRLGVGADGQMRDDKHLPAIAAMLDEQQFELIARGQRRARRDPGQRRQRQDHGRAAPRRVPRVPRAAALPARARCSSSSRTRRSSTTSGACCRRSASRACPVTTFARFASRARRRSSSRGCPRRSATRRRRSCRARRRTRRCCARIARLAARIARHGRRARARAAMAQVAGRASWRSRRGRRPDARRNDAAGRARVAALAVARGQAAARRRWRRRRACRTSRAARSSSSCADLRPQTRARGRRVGRALTSRELLARPSRASRGFGPAQLDQVHAWCVRQARVRSEGERDGEEPTLDAEDTRCSCAAGKSSAGRSSTARPSRSASRTSSSTRCRTRAPSSSRVLLELTGKDALHHARRRRRAAHARRRRRPRRVRLERAARRARRAAHDDRAAQGELPLDGGDHAASRAACSGPVARRRARATRQRPARSSSSRSRRRARRSRSSPTRSSSSRATSRTRTSRSSRASRSRRTSTSRASSRAEVPERAPRRQARLHVGAWRRRDRRAADQGPRVRRGRPARDDRLELPGVARRRGTRSTSARRAPRISSGASRARRRPSS